MNIVLYVITTLLYSVLAFSAWHTYYKLAASSSLVHSLTDASEKTHQQQRLNWMSVLLLIALILHGSLLHRTVFIHHNVVFGFAFALSAMLWLGCCVYWVESFFWPLEAMSILIFPLASIASILPLLFGGGQILFLTTSPFFKIHFVIANIAYGLFVIVALHAVLLLLAERYLHVTLRKKEEHARSWVMAWLDMLPPLLTLEHLLFRLLYVAFAFLTMTLLSGLFFQEQLNIHSLMNHKNIYALFAWCIVLGLLLAHRIYGWRGRAVARWVLVAFVVLLFAYVGSRFVQQIF